MTCGAVELCAQKAARGCDGRAAQHPMRQRTHTWRHATGVIRRGSELRLRCASAGRRRSRRRFSAALLRAHRVACGALVLHVRAERRDLFVVERQVLRARHRPDGPAPQGCFTHAHARGQARALARTRTRTHQVKLIGAIAESNGRGRMRALKESRSSALTTYAESGRHSSPCKRSLGSARRPSQHCRTGVCGVCPTLCACACVRV